MTELPALTLAAGLPALPLVLAASALLFLPGYAAETVLLPTPRYRSLKARLEAEIGRLSGQVGQIGEALRRDAAEIGTLAGVGR